MRTTLTIARREIASYFDSLVAYVMLVLFLGFSGFFTWIYGSDIFLVGQASLSVFFAIAYWTLFFFIPALTMRLIAEERKSGTLELMLTKALNQRQWVLGKFLGAWFLIAVALLCTLPYIITLYYIGNPDTGQIIGGYLGLLLMSASYIGVGIFASSLTSNQVVAFLIALVIGLSFHIVFGVLSQNLTGTAGQVFFYLNMSNHFEGIARGVVDTRNIIYFVSIAFLGLYLAEQQINRIKISGQS